MRIFSCLIEKYRSSRFEPYTSDFTKYIYAKRNGCVSDLQSRFSSEEINNAKLLDRIKTPNNDFEDKYWMLTNKGAVDIKLLYKKSSCLQKIHDFYLRLKGFDGRV